MRKIDCGFEKGILALLSPFISALQSIHLWYFCIIHIMAYDRICWGCIEVPVSRRLQAVFFLYYYISVHFEDVLLIILNVIAHTSCVLSLAPEREPGVLIKLLFVMFLFLQCSHNRREQPCERWTFVMWAQPEAVVPISTADPPLKIPLFHRISGTLARVNYWKNI